MSIPNEDLVRMAGRAWDKHQILRSIWQEYWRYTAPERYVLSMSSEEGYDHSRALEDYRRVQDSTAVDALAQAVNFVVAEMFPAGAMWFLLQAGTGVEPGERGKENKDGSPGPP